MKNIFLVVSIVILILSSCNSRVELYYPAEHNGYLDILTDWGDAEDLPDGIVMYFYPEGSPSIGTKPRIEYLSNNGAKDIFFPFGQQQSFAYNDNAKNVLFNGMDDYSTAEVYLIPSTKAPFSTRNADTEQILEPDLFYVCHIDPFSLGVDNTSHKITILPILATIDLSFDIGVEGLHNVRNAESAVRGSLSGVAKSIKLSTGKGEIEDFANVVFDFNVSETEISATVRCFGLLYDKNSTNLLELAFALKDGSEHIVELDITEVITEPSRENGGDIPINKDIYPIKIEDVIPDGGMDFGVDPWGETIIVVPEPGETTTDQTSGEGG